MLKKLFSFLFNKKEKEPIVLEKKPIVLEKESIVLEKEPEEDKTQKPFDFERYIEYLNIGRGEIWGREDLRLYSIDDIVYSSIPSKDCLCYVITDKGRSIPHAMYYKAKQEWWRGYIRNSLVEEEKINDNVIAFIPYDLEKYNNI